MQTTNKILIAHRGMSSLAPENTLAAFNLCKQYNIEWFECDIDILGDGTLVVSHDETLDRCTNRSGALIDLKSMDLVNIDAGSWFSDDFKNEPIPTATQLIQLANQQQLNLNIEIKSCQQNQQYSQLMIDNLIEALEYLESSVQLIVSSFDHQLLATFKQQRPQTQVACLFEQHQLTQNWHDSINLCQADFIHPENTGLTQMQVQSFQDSGLKVNVWTVNSLTRAQQLFSWGVDGVCTDRAQDF